MKRLAFAVFAFGALGAALFAGEPAPPPPPAAPPSDVQAFLKDARAKHVDLTAAGLQSFSARIRLESSPGLEGEMIKDQTAFVYSWTAPDKEDRVLDPVPEGLRKPLADMTPLLWRDLSGAHFFDSLLAIPGLKLEKGPESTLLSGSAGGYGMVKAVFEKDTDRFVSVEFAKSGFTLKYTHSVEQDRFRILSRETLGRQGVRAARHVYSGFKKFGEFVLPTRFTVEIDKGTFRFGAEYIMINGEAARPAPPDIEEVKARIKELEKGWSRLSEADKKAKLGELSEIDHDLASAAVANLGLRDGTVGVRREAANLLGSMARKNVVPALIAAMRPNEKSIEAYSAVIWALGEIGDPRAVDVLSKDWWNQKIGENGVAAAKKKIQALGKILDKTAVDALIETFYLAQEETVGWLKGDIHASLAQLTGQDFGLDRKAWKEWWKAKRASFRFQ
jgi:hypothetical protein